MMPPGFCYLDGDDVEGIYHLHVVASAEDAEGFVVVVSISTMNRFADRTVVLKGEEHSWLKHESFVAYNFARLQRAAEIEARLRAKPQMIKAHCTDALLRRIQGGLLESERTENGVKHFYREVAS